MSVHKRAIIMICSVAGCIRSVRSKGLCGLHYERLRHHGSTDPRIRGYKHGHASGGKCTPTYRAWSGILDRCTRPPYRDYARYGGRGITVCARWLASFENFLADMGEAPLGLSIERRNNDGNYEPGNCKWATPTEQANNRSNNQMITYQGRTLTLAETAREHGISPWTLRSRIFDYGYSVEKALTKAIGTNGKRRSS